MSSGTSNFPPINLVEYVEGELGFGSKRYLVTCDGTTVGKMIAAAFDGFDDDTVYIEWITVDREYLRQGFATAAIAQLCTMLGRTKAIPVKENLSAAGFWEKLRRETAFGVAVGAEVCTNTVDELRSLAQPRAAEAPR